jgi:3',5'-cyclic AMP phosphodiesterase CpdA
MRAVRAGGLVIAVLAAVFAAGCGEGAAPRPPPGSTLRATLVDRDGDGALERGPGEPLRDRTELGGGGRPTATLATFAQLTDLHVRDEESPARVPFLDRLGGVFGPTFRPQEALSTQVLAAAVRSLNRLHPQAVAVTGDIADNAQADELDLARAVLSGGRVHPDSGAAGYTGVQEAGNPDPFYYRPDVDPPRHPGLLAAAQRPFDAPGLDAPWYPTFGNHDLLAQGETPPTARIQALATGDRMVEALDPGVRPSPGTDSAAAVDALLASGVPGRSRAVPADPARRLVGPAEAARRLGRSLRHGRLDYTFDIGPAVRAIVLDTVDRRGGARGQLTREQLGWLRGALRAAGARYVVVFAHNPLETSDGGEAALAALDAAPRVVAVISGNRHRNTITARPSGPYWLIGTASLADYPMQARAFRLVRTAEGSTAEGSDPTQLRNKGGRGLSGSVKGSDPLEAGGGLGGGLALETWVVDQDGRGLAGVARELAFLDAQGGRPRGLAGAAADRNARLHLP